MSSSGTTICKLLNCAPAHAVVEKKQISFKDQFRKLRQQPNNLDGDVNSKFTQKGNFGKCIPLYEAVLEFHKHTIENTDEAGAFLFMVAHNDVKKVNIIVGEYILINKDLILLKGISNTSKVHMFYTLTFDKSGDVMIQLIQVSSIKEDKPKGVAKTRELRDVNNVKTRDFWDDISSAFSSASTVVSSAVSSASTVVSSAVTTAASESGLDNTVDFIGNEVSTVTKAVVAVASNAADSISSIVVSNVKTFDTTISKDATVFGNAIVRTADDVASDVKKALDSIWKSIVKPFIDPILKEVATIGETCFGSVAGALTLLTGDPVAIALQLGECLTTYLISMIKNNTTREILQAANVAIQLLLGTAILASDVSDDDTEFTALQALVIVSDTASVISEAKAEIKELSPTSSVVIAGKAAEEKAAKEEAAKEAAAKE